MWLTEFLKQESFWALIGVVLGFLLGEGSRVLRDRRRIGRLTAALDNELRSIRAQIPQKVDVVNQMRASAKQGRILPGLSVSTLDGVYRGFHAELYPHLSLRQRNCLHVIYERLAIADRVLATFEQDVRAAISEGLVNDPFASYHDRLGELIESYNVVQALITSYLARDPTDVFDVGESYRCRAT